MCDICNPEINNEKIDIYKDECNEWVLYVELPFDYNCAYAPSEEVYVKYCPFCGRGLYK